MVEAVKWVGQVIEGMHCAFAVAAQSAQIGYMSPPALSMYSRCFGCVCWLMQTVTPLFKPVTSQYCCGGGFAELMHC